MSNSLNVKLSFPSSNTTGPRQTAIFELLRRGTRITAKSLAGQMGLLTGDEESDRRKVSGVGVALMKLRQRRLVEAVPMTPDEKRHYKRRNPDALAFHYPKVYVLTAVAAPFKRNLANLRGTGNNLAVVLVGVPARSPIDE